MVARRQYPKISMYQEEIVELYEDCLRSDGFDCDLFNSKLSCHLKAAQIDAVDLEQLEQMLKEVAFNHWDQIARCFKKVA